MFFLPLGSQSNSSHRPVQFRTLRGRIKCSSLSHLRRLVLANILLRRVHCDLFRRPAGHSYRSVHGDRSASDEQPGYHIARPPEQRAQVPQTGDTYAGRSRRQFLRVPATFPGVYPVDNHHAGWNDHVARPGRLLHAGILLPHDVVPEFGNEPNTVQSDVVQVPRRISAPS